MAYFRAMNANESFPKTNARLKRIKFVSRMVRYLFLALLIASFCFYLFVIILFFTILGWQLPFVVAFGVLICVWYWKLAQLFGLYQRGLIFNSKNISCIKFLGILCIIQWALGNIWSFCREHYPLPPISPTPPLAITFAKILSSHFDFFSFGFYGIDFGFLLDGIVIVLIAWIMDEGRKIQEEQELTV